MSISGHHGAVYPLWPQLLEGDPKVCLVWWFLVFEPPFFLAPGVPTSFRDLVSDLETLIILVSGMALSVAPPIAQSHISLSGWKMKGLVAS